MSSKIRILNELAINQIAAGEVIESSASCVKELIENSIDAGSSQITIETKAAGRGLIHVQDNGSGMPQDDLLLSIERHATSKIENSSDLFYLKTLGFRGEALASIASVSKMTLHSAQEKSEGNLLEVEGGKIQFLKPLPRRRGTSIEIKRLFYNVPVRKKFQKSESHDQSLIHKIIVSSALGHPEIGFEWSSEDKIQFSLPPVTFDEGYIERLETLLGKSFTQSLTPVCIEETDCKIAGYISTPSFHKPTRTSQYLFINSRPVASPFISSIVNEGYGTRIPENRFPSFLLHLFLPPSWVDVNVHPQKTFVRLSEEDKIRHFLLKAIESALQAKALPIETSKHDFSTTQYFNFPPTSLFPESKVVPPVPELFHQKIQSMALFSGYILLHSSYIPTFPPSSLAIVDERAAKRRIFFEALPSSTLSIQQLLVPVIVNLSALEESLIEETNDMIASTGIELRSLGSGSFAIDAIHSHFEADQVEILISKLLENLSLSKGESFIKDEIQKKIAFSLCREIRKTCKSKEEGNLIVEKLLLCKEPFQCPLGKPTVIVVSEKDIEKWF